jgi:hypothetical protein
MYLHPGLKLRWSSTKFRAVKSARAVKSPLFHALPQYCRQVSCWSRPRVIVWGQHMPAVLLSMCVTKRRKKTREGRKHSDSRHQRNTPKRKPSLTVQTSSMPQRPLRIHHANTSCPPSRHIATAQTSTKPQSNPQHQDPERKYRRLHTSTREDITVPPVGTEGNPSVARQTGTSHPT